MFDNIECLSINAQSKDFPMHYHETFCISLIREGIEKIELENQSLYSSAGHISITNPYEVHANPLSDEHMKLSFDTVYISADLVKYLANGRTIEFTNRQISDVALNHSFTRLRNNIQASDIAGTQASLRHFMQQLRPFVSGRADEYRELNTAALSEVLDFIEHNLSRKISLDELAYVSNMNKYGFAKKFRTLTGMTPINYVMMKKIFAIKKMIRPDSELTALAFQYDFTDLAHFSNTFKQFVGISPRDYKNIQHRS